MSALIVNMMSHQLINQTSGRTEWYTPPEIIEAARRVMGGIDLDPASSAAANVFVKATTIYTRPRYTSLPSSPGYDTEVRAYEDWGGLSNAWFGNVWMNHPFGNPQQPCEPGCKKKTCLKRDWHTHEALPGNADWIDKVVAEYRSGRVNQACVLTYAATSAAWFRPLLDCPICFFYGRTQYIDPATGKPSRGVTKGSCLTYLGPNLEAFAREFGNLGAVKVSLWPSMFPEPDFELIDWVG